MFVPRLSWQQVIVFHFKTKTAQETAAVFPHSRTNVSSPPRDSAQLRVEARLHRDLQAGEVRGRVAAPQRRTPALHARPCGSRQHDDITLTCNRHRNRSLRVDSFIGEVCAQLIVLSGRCVLTLRDQTVVDRLCVEVRKHHPNLIALRSTPCHALAQLIVLSEECPSSSCDSFIEGVFW